MTDRLVMENSVKTNSVNIRAVQSNCSGEKCSKNVIRGLVASNRNFYFNGMPFRILGGSFHYFRTHPQQWKNRLEKMKAAGLNTVTTYIPWNLHEQVRGKYEFRGLFNLPNFIKLVQKVGLLLIVRPGPYICAEWEFGGLPSWLLHDPNMKVRTSKYKPYMHQVMRFFDQLLPLLAKFTYKSNSGPIIAFQIENEFGSYGHDNEYMQFLRGLYDRYGLDELLFTSDGKDHLHEGSIPGILASVNFNKGHEAALNALEEFQPDKPLLVAEFWPGWFDHWGERHHKMPVDEFTTKVDAILSRNASINFYMFVGGTNFGFWNGANAGELTNLATVTSYDYDAMISENGDIHPTKYEAFRKLLEKHHLVEGSLPRVPNNSPKVAFGEVPITEVLQLKDLVRLLPKKLNTLMEPVFMEQLSIDNDRGQGYGWILYRTWFSSGRSLHLIGKIQDRALILVNGKQVAVIHSKSEAIVERTIDLTTPLQNNNTLEVLVENMGRVNYMTLDDQRCGFLGSVKLDGEPLSPWQLISLDFTDEFVSQVQQMTSWRPFSSGPSPCLCRGFLNTNSVEDTFLDMQNWKKGVVLVNGFNVGRYWNIGPQQTLYIPKPVLKNGQNEIIVFELEKPDDKLAFVAKPILNKTKAH